METAFSFVIQQLRAHKEKQMSEFFLTTATQNKGMLLLDSLPEDGAFSAHAALKHKEN